MVADDRKVTLEGIDGILVYEDSSVPALHYYCSTRPAIARVANEDQLTLIHYQQPVNGIAGMLSFVVNLEPDPKAIAAVQEQLNARTPGAQLSPMPWTSGTVSAAVIGGNPVFATPSLLGSNSAVISTPLTVDQYIMLKNRGKDVPPPISVVYSLSFEAFRPEYAFSIQFDESRFRDWVQKKCTANILFISVENVETFEDLRQSGVIRVESVNQTGETPPEGFQRAFLASLQSILTPLPQFAPPPEGGGSNWLIGFDCKTVRDTQNIARRLDTNMQIAGAVTRRLYLQSAPDRFDEALANRPDVELPTAQRFRQNLTVRCSTAFDGQPLQAAQVSIRYPVGTTVYTHVYDKDHPDEWDVELVHNPGTTSEYAYRCDLYFGDGTGANFTCSSGLIGIRREQAFLDVLPETCYTWRRYAVSAAKDFPWDLVKSVNVTMQGSDFSFEPPTLQLRRTTPEGTIAAFTARAASLDDIEFTAAFQPEDGAEFRINGIPAGATIFLNPFRSRTVTFRAASDFDWDQFTRIVVTPDRSNGAPQLWPRAQGKFLLTRNSDTVRFKYWFAGDRKLRFRQALVQNNTTLTPTTTETADAVVSISSPAVKTQTT